MTKAAVRGVLVVLGSCVLGVPALHAATYVPMSDRDLIRLAPLVVRAEVLDRTGRVGRVGAEEIPLTIVTLRVLETFKGAWSESTIRVRLPGGKAGGRVWSVPGTPGFEPGQEVVLMLDAIPDGSGEHRLTEFGLSKFDLVSDAAGRRFAVRPVFPAQSDLELSRVERGLLAESMSDPTRAPARDGESFLAVLRALRGGAEPGPIGYAVPAGALRRAGAGWHTEWANVGGREPSNEQRWFWDTGQSPAATAVISGTQSNLDTDDPCGIDSVCYVQNAINGWHGIAETDVRIDGPAPTGNLKIFLDAAASIAWSTPLPCEGGALGIAGPEGDLSPTGSFKGDGPFFAALSGTVWMRINGCATTPLSGKVFKTAVMHEIGHCLGLAHPDLFTSMHSQTPAASWKTAVMTSSIQPARPSTPQTDDIQAMQYFYGTAAPGPVPAANFTFSPAHPDPGDLVTFTNTTADPASGYLWVFGDPSFPSHDVNPTHTFAFAGTYAVRLNAANLNGTGTIFKNVTVGTGGPDGGGGGGTTCTANDTTLCLSASRFKVTAVFQKPNDIQRTAHAVPLTANTGYFWFFDNTNVEVVTKVLPFCADPYNSIWVFAAGLTNVKVDVTYLDTKTGTTVVKSNPQSTAFLPVQDTKAFKTCP